MRIANVRSYLLDYVFPKPIVLEYYGGVRRIVKRDSMLIRVEAANGVIGYAPGQASESAKRMIDSEIAPFLHGKVLKDPDALRILFIETVKPTAELLKIYATVEIALYDLAGKLAGVPVSELLGGRVRDAIALYSSAGMYMPPEGYAREAAQAKELGFNAYKMRPGISPEGDVEAVKRMREATGFGFELMVDAHTWWRMGDRSYTPEQVAAIAEKLSGEDITWLEEPMPPLDHAAYRKLHEQAVVPLASGEHEPDEASFLDLIATECVDYVQLDVLCQGGYPQARRLFPEIERAGLMFAFHSWGTALEIMAAAQLGITWPEHVVRWLEYPLYTDDRYEFMYEFPLANEILKSPLQVEDGYLVVPRTPGLGIEVNEAVLEKYPWVPGPWSYFTLHSPASTFAVISDHSIPWAGEGAG